MRDLLALVKNNFFSFQLKSINRLQFIILAVCIYFFFLEGEAEGG